MSNFATFSHRSRQRPGTPGTAAQSARESSKEETAPGVSPGSESGASDTPGATDKQQRNEPCAS
jgi:hypothetical protein